MRAGCMAVGTRGMQGAQTADELAPVASENPGVGASAHDVQFATLREPTASEKVPMGQALHASAPVAFAYVPGGHTLHAAAAAGPLVKKEPASQRRHVPSPPITLPRGQVAHAVATLVRAPSAATKPGGQGVHEAPAPALQKPRRHGAHDAEFGSAS